MARKRMIDPEFWSDEEIGSWSFQARLFYIGLWNFADDEGRFKAHSLLLKSQIFPYENKIDIDALKSEVSGKVFWYESNGSSYGYVRNFLKYQKINKPTESKLPTPPPLPNLSCSPPVALPRNRREEKRREKKRSEGTDTSVGNTTQVDFMQSLKDNPAFNGIDIDLEAQKAQRWLASPRGRGRRLTKQFFINWLNRADGEIKVNREPDVLERLGVQ